MITMNWIPICLNWTILFKCLEMTIVVIWRYIYKTELNWIELLSRLDQYASISGAAHKLLQSYPTNRSFSVKCGEFSSSMAPLTCGDPQGSVLGPLQFPLYMLPLGSIFSRHNISFHCYADDIQIYLPLSTNCKDSLTTLFACLAYIKSWMSQSHLNFNDNKTEVIVYGHPSCSIKSVASMGRLTSKTSLQLKTFWCNFGHLS